MQHPPQEPTNSDDPTDEPPQEWIALFHRVDNEAPPNRESHVALRTRINELLDGLAPILDEPATRFEGQDCEFHTELSGTVTGQRIGISISQWGHLATVTTPAEPSDPLVQRIESHLRNNGLTPVPFDESSKRFDGDLERYVRPVHAPTTWFDRFFGYS